MTSRSSSSTGTAGVPHGQWKTATFVAGLRIDGIAARFVLDGPINQPAFLAYVDQVLGAGAPARRNGLMDNLSSYKGAAFPRAIEPAGVSCASSRPSGRSSRDKGSGCRAEGRRVESTSLEKCAIFTRARRGCVWRRSDRSGSRRCRAHFRCRCGRPCSSRPADRLGRSRRRGGAGRPCRVYRRRCTSF